MNKILPDDREYIREYGGHLIVPVARPNTPWQSGAAQAGASRCFDSRVAVRVEHAPGSDMNFDSDLLRRMGVGPDGRLMQ